MNRFSFAVLARLMVLVLLVVSAGCRRGDDTAARTDAPVAGVEVTEVRLGRSVTPDRRVSAETDSFGTRDTIYASVATQGSANNVALTARWTYQDGQVVDESRENISPTGPANTAFHIFNPGGWPAGNYRIEILVNDRAAESRQFTVR
jgi:hypothetical protein